MHDSPHFPQLEGSLLWSTHTPLQRVLPGGHAVQALPAQICPAAHATPQAPQFEGSTDVFTQAFPHLVLPPPQLRTHTPAEQTRRN